MLVIKRKPNQDTHISLGGQHVGTIRVVETCPGSVRLGFIFGREYEIARDDMRQTAPAPPSDSARVKNS